MSKKSTISFIRKLIKTQKSRLIFIHLFSLIGFFFIDLVSYAQPTVGLLLNEADTYPAYTLFSNNKNTYLIDNCGLLINTWSSAFSPGEAVYLLQNGNLLRTAEVEGNFNAGGLGGRFELFNWENELLWYYEYVDENTHAHHDITPLPNGNFLFIAWEKKSEEAAQQKGRMYSGEVWSERVIELEMMGFNRAKVIWEWRAWDHLIQDQNPALDNYGKVAEHPERIDLNYIGEGENTAGNWIHLNAIDYNAQLDQIALSSRLFSEIWIIDHSTTSQEAASSQGGKYGKGGDLLYRFGNPNAYQKSNEDRPIFKNQHDVRWIPDAYPQGGKLMVFNNNKAEKQSSIEIWTAPIDANGNYWLHQKGVYGPDTIDWTYQAEGFYSRLMSGAHLLPNGNLFVCEGQTGRFFEITPNHQKIWEYINPINSNGGPAIQGGTPRFNQSFRATKYPHFYPAFDGKNMEGQQPIELNPIENECFVPIFEKEEKIEISIVENPIMDRLIIHSNAQNRILTLQVFNVKGQNCLEKSIRFGKHEIAMTGLTSGFYFLLFWDEENFIQTNKIVLL